MKYLYLDLETRAPVSVTDIGVYAYAEQCEIILVSCAVDDGSVHVINSMQELPLEVRVALDDPEVTIVAHNSMFDRTVLRLAGYDYPVERWEDTMVLAYSAAFPGSLDDVGAALGLPPDQRKMKEGKSLIRLFCQPQKDGTYATEYTHRERWNHFVEYARQDVATMRIVHKRLPRWNWTKQEKSLWYLDQKINDRGFAVDLDLARAGADAAATEKDRLLELFPAPCKPSQREQFKAWVLETYGIALADTTSDTMANIYEDDGQPESLRRACEIVVAYNRTSTKKFDAMLRAVSSDGRFRGGLQYNGAQRTRRWAGRFFQPQNLPSRGLPKAPTVAAYIDALKEGVHDVLFDDDIMRLSSAAIRGLIVAPQGRKLVISDLSNIEGRVCAWLAGEDWKLKAFRAFDAGTGPDLYNLTATSIVGGDPWNIDKTTRNAFGKVPELALQFQSGVHGLQTFATNYHVRFADHWSMIQSNIDADTIAYARHAFDERGRSSGLSEIEWVASEAVKLAWRNRHPRIRALWKACQEAARCAINRANVWYAAGKHLRFRTVHKGRDKYLIVALPSGRYLVYYEPRLDGEQISYMGYGDDGDKGARRWCRRKIYGGRFVANATQASAGDVLRDRLPDIEGAGYEIELLVHDEGVTESDDGTAQELSSILATPPPWCHDLPLAAAGFETTRYRKE